MTGFRDMTFCTSPCANTDCKRMLTDLIREEAWAWWGGDGAPIAVARFEGWCGEHKPKGQSDD